ncbi:hypothetical protein DPMN_167407 [Dreissena polymorpha]|uniref:HAT C-terminal dimerisation domain-containing protein n=1 Tax=Dreissena polymorpha TaxID=45954 RepID=A0A9D4IYK3_DREPO|nr:hypothetical protein DPMN_167407 [Dreissena polymorpha]
MVTTDAQRTHEGQKAITIAHHEHVVLRKSFRQTAQTKIRRRIMRRFIWVYAFKCYLVMQGTSVPSERIFSTAGDLVSAHRACLDPDNVDILVGNDPGGIAGTTGGIAVTVGTVGTVNISLCSVGMCWNRILKAFANSLDPDETTERGTDRQTDRQTETDRWMDRQTETDRWADRQRRTDRQTDRQTDRWADRQTDEQTQADR